MRNSLTALLALLIFSGSALAENQTNGTFNWQQWRHLPVQDGGRRKPLDSLAWETLRIISNRAAFTDPETSARLDATAWYLSMLFDWQPAERPSTERQAASPHGSFGTDPRKEYFGSREPDKWDRAPLLLIGSRQLQAALGIAEDQKYISPLALSQAKISQSQAAAELPFSVWAEKLAREKQQGLSLLENKVLELADRLWLYQELRMGRRLEVLPMPGSEHEEWASVADLLRADLSDKNDSGGGLRKVKQLFVEARAAYRAGSAEAFNKATTSFFHAIADLGPQLGPYPRQNTIDLEVAYNHWVPFRFAWALSLLACVSVLLSMGSRWKPFYFAALIAFAAALVAMCIGFAMRVAISGRAPVSNMYESVIYVGLGVAFLGMIFELIYRRQYVLVAAAAVSTLTLILADNCPALLDPSLQPLQPVLRNNYWLVIHVMTITLSYAAFALALGISDITLGYYLAGSRNRESIAALSRFTYRALQVGVELLAVGTVTGAIWADYSWGRFWSWDPKEVWALIALLVYLAPLHARYIGWVGHLGLAVSAVIASAVVVMAWYGVNYLMGTGLHSYGFNTAGGEGYVAAVIAAQFLYMLLAAARGMKGQQAPSLAGI